MLQNYLRDNGVLHFLKKNNKMIQLFNACCCLYIRTHEKNLQQNNIDPDIYLHLIGNNEEKER